MNPENEETRLIADIKHLLDTDLPDADTRAALQKARIRALSQTEKRRQRSYWLEFAVAASLVAVVVVNLPQHKNDDSRPSVKVVAQQSDSPIKAPAVTQPQVLVAEPPSRPLTAVKPAVVQATVTDIDLLENLDLYEDTEFYEWLSEQDSLGGLDA
jgi:hypothetical protein